MSQAHRAEYKRQWHLDHRESDLKRFRRYKLEHPEEVRWSNQLLLARYRREALRIVSKSQNPRCASCGCDNADLLEINHASGGGKKEGRENPHLKGIRLYRNIIKGIRPTDDLNVLCAPCNLIHYIRLKYGDVADRFEVEWLGASPSLTTLSP